MAGPACYAPARMAIGIDAAGSVRAPSGSLRRKLHRSRYLYALFAAPFAFYVLFEYAPLYGVLIAFTDTKVFRGLGAMLTAPGVGFKHFEQYLTDPYFWQLARNTVLLQALGLAVGFPAPIILALMLNEVRAAPFKRVIQSITYLPHFISLVVICGMIVNFVATDGVVNDFLAVLGLPRTSFLVRPEWFRPIYLASEVWQDVGWGSIIYLAALTNVDPQLYEAAALDGAGRLRQLRHVTWPGILPTVVILFILALGRIMEVGYQKIILLYTGATYETADVISTFVYRRGLIQSDFPYATAVGLFTSVIGVVFVVSANRISRSLGRPALW